MSMLNFKNPDQMVTSIIMVVVGVILLTSLLPTVIDNLVNLSLVDNLGFASFYEGGGVVLLILGAAVFLGILGVVGLKKSGRK